MFGVHNVFICLLLNFMILINRLMSITITGFFFDLYIYSIYVIKN